MKERMKKTLVGLAGIVLAAIVILLPTNLKSAEAAVTPITPVTINRPNDIANNLHSDVGLAFEIQDTQYTYLYYSFTISERGYGLIYSTDYSSMIDISMSPSFNTVLSISYRDVEYLEGGYLLKWYLDPGTYYVRAKSAKDYSHYYGYKAYCYFLPNSKFFSSSVSHVNCSTDKLTVVPKTNMVSSFLFNSILPLKEVNDIHNSGETSVDDIYSITTNGEYTICVESSMTEWKGYKFMQSFEVYDLGNHPTVVETVTSPASFTQDGLITKKCTTCNTVIGTTPIAKVSIPTISKSNNIYTGKNIAPSVYVSLNPAYYTVTYTNNKKVGTAYAKITLGGGRYTGEYTIPFEIVPKGVSLKKLTSEDNSITVTWNKAKTDFTGYEIQVSTSKSFPSSKSKTKTVTVKSKTKTSTKVSKLKSGKSYYVRIRTYKTVSGKKYTSSWSKTSKIKVQ